MMCLVCEVEVCSVRGEATGDVFGVRGGGV